MIPAGITLIISGNNITNVDGLSQLTSIGGELDIQYNPLLMNVDGFSQLSSIGGYLNIQSSPGLTNIDGFSQLTSIGGYLSFGSNSLPNIDGFSQLTSVGGNLIFSYNSDLTNVDGFSQLTSVGGSLLFIDNPLLPNLDGLSQLTSVGGEVVLFNTALTNIDGLGQLTSVGGNLQVTSNAALNQCCALCSLLAADAADATVIGGTVTIQNNLTDCNSEAEVNACSPCGLAPVPTLGQWGLILLALFLLNIGALSIFQSRYQVAGLAGTYFSSMNMGFAAVLTDRKAFLKQYVFAAVFIMILFAISMLFFGYELMPFDVLGSILAAGLLAFLMRTLEQRSTDIPVCT